MAIRSSRTADNRGKESIYNRGPEYPDPIVHLEEAASKEGDLLKEGPIVVEKPDTGGGSTKDLPRPERPIGDACSGGWKDSPGSSR